jgi:hypothetical protein
MRELVAACAAAALALAFGWAAIAKALYWVSWRDALRTYALPRAVYSGAVLGVPLIELALVAMMLSGEVVVGATLTVFLLASFSLAVVRAQIRNGSARLPCGCFGRAKSRDYRFLLIRNTFLGVLASIILLSGRNVLLLGGLGRVPMDSVGIFGIAAGVAALLGVAAHTLAAPRRRT